MAATDIGVMMTILGFVFWRQWMANRAAQRAASASAQVRPGHVERENLPSINTADSALTLSPLVHAQGAGGAGGVDGLLQLVLNPVVRMLGGTVPNTRWVAVAVAVALQYVKVGSWWAGTYN